LIRILFIGQQKITYNEVKSQGEQLLSTFLRGFFPANIDTRALQTQTETATKTNKIRKENNISMLAKFAIEWQAVVYYQDSGRHMLAKSFHISIQYNL